MRRDDLREGANEHKKGAKSRDQTALQPSRSAHADQLTDEQPEIEAADVDQQPLANVRVPTQEQRRMPPVS